MHRYPALLLFFALACTARHTDAQVEFEYSEPDTSLPHGATHVAQDQWIWLWNDNGLEHVEEASGSPGTLQAIHWSAIESAEEGVQIYAVEFGGSSVAWQLGTEQIPEPTSLWFTFGIGQSQGDHIPLQMWIDENRTLMLDYYQEEFQGTYGPPNMGPGSHFLVLSDIDPSRFDALGARYLGEHETDGW